MYKLFATNYGGAAIIRLADNAFIPFDPANTDYQTFLKWLAEGGVPLEADAP